ncbi:MAG: GNAT family N-acetyltransferase [Anaerolineales bacterium]|nr:GNAT family N-acetyltransferase [Anaerolineales bacterium]
MNELLSKLQIQTAHLFDLSPLRRLEKICFPLDAWPLMDMIGALSFPNIVRYKALWEGEMIAFIAGEIRYPSRTGWIATVCVHPDHRRKGIARTLISMTEEEMGQPRVRLTVRATNYAAINLYRADGYVEIDRWVKYYKGEEDAIVMEKIR